MKLPKNKKVLLCAVAGVIGIIMIICGSLNNDDTSVSDEKLNRVEQEETEKYIHELKKEIKDLCESVSGISNVNVAVTLESGFEYVYATEVNNKLSSGKADSEKKYLTIGSGKNESVVYITEKPPVIGGIGVVCRGGKDPEKVKTLTLLLSAAYNIGTNKIFITGT